jgi:hypothetical protein
MMRHCILKALNGVFLIDDFGRQRIEPRVLLNRWITPMEKRVDFLRLHTGKTFSVPFDELVIFSTNIPAEDIMDPALLRRIPYKIKLSPPEPEAYRHLFAEHSKSYGIEVSNEVIDFIIETLSVKNRIGLAYFQPEFICAQAAEICRSFDLVPRLTRALATEALSNIYVQIETAATLETPAPELT